MRSGSGMGTRDRHLRCVTSRKNTGRSGRQKAATRRNMRREERVAIQGPVKKQRPDGMSHRGLHVHSHRAAALRARKGASRVPRRGLLETKSWAIQHEETRCCPQGSSQVGFGAGGRGAEAGQSGTSERKYSSQQISRAIVRGPRIDEDREAFGHGGGGGEGAWEPDDPQRSSQQHSTLPKKPQLPSTTLNYPQRPRAATGQRNLGGRV